jgi:hypothetical protein
MSKTYNLFISHSWSYGDTYRKLIDLLNSRQYFNYNNYSIPQDDPVHTNGTDKQLIEAIKRKMTPCHIVIVLAGVYASYSKWINKEIYIATNIFFVPKKILAIVPWGAEHTSSVVKNSTDRIVKFNTESIVSAIRDLA